ncbi:uncharacterized protein TRAVEDRAFT_24388 [Trametes versicolor FP-101664 SS1]|uniref:uncharacterized protein n=1 Tax=Trametes versicolor (strain FP-101664) TaxID=717944 RepID=UPI0004623FF6|nr:uncharacterized protein TRAVEDRAFT_24388 [Trametes versicolor FP-101664 SS1]EIW53059.1 hypothetical protein TRAVEDRAFT_24388 [Trametes versicolor FP-101664 SS1]
MEHTSVHVSRNICCMVSELSAGHILVESQLNHYEIRQNCIYDPRPTGNKHIHADVPNVTSMPCAPALSRCTAGRAAVGGRYSDAGASRHARPASRLRLMYLKAVNYGGDTEDGWYLPTISVNTAAFAVLPLKQSYGRDLSAEPLGNPPKTTDIWLSAPPLL